MLVRRAKPLPVECIVRGYLAGSLWQAYRRNTTVCGIRLPLGMQESEKFPSPLFTPPGIHDENIPLKRMVEMVGPELTAKVREACLRLYRQAADYALSRGIIIADTKFELGLTEDNELILIDEVLTPDSSRFWPRDQYRPGGPQPSFDKQFLRDYLDSLNWTKSPPPPPLPAEIIVKTGDRYRQALSWLIA